MKNVARKPPAPTVEDRFAKIISHANELSKTRLRETKQAANDRWSTTRRAEKSALIQKHRPWQNATGPKTAEGKARSSRNAAGRRADNVIDDMIKHTMKEISRNLRAIEQATNLLHHAPEVAERKLARCKSVMNRTNTRILALLALGQTVQKLGSLRIRPTPSLRGGAADEAIHLSMVRWYRRMDCFAPLAMTNVTAPPSL